jgi:hypothetical protein
MKLKKIGIHYQVILAIIQKNQVKAHTKGTWGKQNLYKTRKRSIIWHFDNVATFCF